MKLKKAIGAIALIAILICGIYAAGAMYDSGTTYDGSKTDVIALYENPQEYDAVSYTHLDVYKRQPSIFLSWCILLYLSWKRQKFI